MPNIFLPRVSESMTYTSLVADPGRLAGFGKSKQRLKAQFALTPLICSVYLSHAHLHIRGSWGSLWICLLLWPLGWSVCFYLCVGLEKNVAVIIFTLLVVEGPGSPEICKLATIGRCLCQTQEGIRKHHVIGRHVLCRLHPQRAGQDAGPGVGTRERRRKTR